MAQVDETESFVLEFYSTPSDLFTVCCPRVLREWCIGDLFINAGCFSNCSKRKDLLYAEKFFVGKTTQHETLLSISECNNQIILLDLETSKIIKCSFEIFARQILYRQVHIKMILLRNDNEKEKQ